MVVGFGNGHYLLPQFCEFTSFIGMFSNLVNEGVMLTAVFLTFLLKFDTKSQNTEIYDYIFVLLLSCYFGTITIIFRKP